MGTFSAGRQRSKDPDGARPSTAFETSRRVFFSLGYDPEGNFGLILRSTGTEMTVPPHLSSSPRKRGRLFSNSGDVALYPRHPCTICTHYPLLPIVQTPDDAGRAHSKCATLFPPKILPLQPPRPLTEGLSCVMQSREKRPGGMGGSAHRRGCGKRNGCGDRRRGSADEHLATCELGHQRSPWNCAPMVAAAFPENRLPTDSGVFPKTTILSIMGGNIRPLEDSVNL